MKPTTIHVVHMSRTSIVRQLAWSSDWSRCGGLGKFRPHFLRCRSPNFRCGRPYWRLNGGGAWHWLGCSACDSDGHCRGVNLGLGCGAGWRWWLTRRAGRWNLRLRGCFRCWHSCWRTTWLWYVMTLSFSPLYCTTVCLLFGDLHTRYTCPHISG